MHPDLTEPQRRRSTPALRWWASFGGVGARTRRGLGAVKVEGLAAVTPEEVADAADAWCWASSRTAGKAWKASVGRCAISPRAETGPQSRRAIDRSPPGVAAGRSPMRFAVRPGVMRRSTNPEHLVDGRLSSRGLRSTDRVSFQGREAAATHRSSCWYRTMADRMASPLILRPYWNGQQWQPAALLLPGWKRRLCVRVGFGHGGPTARLAHRIRRGPHPGRHKSSPWPDAATIR